MGKLEKNNLNKLVKKNLSEDPKAPPIAINIILVINFIFNYFLRKL